MSANPAEIGIAAWKRQVDLALQIAQAVVEGAEKVREIQHAAAVETHARLEAVRKSVQSAAGVAELATLQGQFASDNLARAADYWSRLAATGRDTQAEIVRIAMASTGSAPLLAPQAQPQAITDLFDAGYKQWMETLQRLYGSVATH